jgi:hypothetical protein
MRAVYSEPSLLLQQIPNRSHVRLRATSLRRMDTSPFHLSSKGKTEFPKKLGPQGWDVFPFATKAALSKFLHI